MENLKVRRRCGASQRGISHGGSESDDPGGCIGQKGREHPDCEMEIVQIPLAVASDMAGAVKKFSKETGNLSIRTSVKQMLVRQQDKSMKQNWQSCG